jgi:H+/Na+-translocating ferredoxin:NAD+ oxidoreductase subunit B
MLTPVVVVAGLALALGALLGFAVIRFRVEGNPTVEKIDEILPQTQCGRCGYAGCRPYAQAIAEGRADINRCPPGGEDNIRRLARLMRVEAKPLAREVGEPKPSAVAVIDESTCIGCALCILACPVDAIVGASKQMHTVIATECTGCELCLPPCPVDCIAMVPIGESVAKAGFLARARAREAAHRARSRHEFRQFRIERDRQEQDARLANRSAYSKTTPASAGESSLEQAE